MLAGLTPNTRARSGTATLNMVTFSTEKGRAQHSSRTIIVSRRLFTGLTSYDDRTVDFS